MGTLSPHGFYEFEEADTEATGSDLLNLPVAQLEIILGPVVDQSAEQASIGWTDGLTSVAPATEVVGNEGQLYAAGDLVGLRGRWTRTGAATGTVTWALIDNSRYWPSRIWELGYIGLQGSTATMTRCYVDTDGGIKSFNTPAATTGLFLSAALVVMD